MGGRVVVEGSGVTVDLQDFAVQTGGCFAIGVQVTGATTKTNTGTVAVSEGPGGFDCPLFRDSFESGSDAHWNAVE